MNIFTTPRTRLRSLGAIVVALGLVFALTPTAQADIFYDKEASSWASGKDSGGRDASSRLRHPSSGNVHYKALFRAYDEVMHVYDYYDENDPGDDPGYAEVIIRNKDNEIVERASYGVWASQGHRSYELGINGSSNVPEGYKIQFRVCKLFGQCSWWAYGRA